MLNRINDFLTKRNTAIILLITGFLVYANIIGAPFIYDDVPATIGNSLIQHISNFPLFFTGHIYSIMRLDYIPDPYIYRPFQQSIHAIIYHFAGIKPFLYHIVQILFHTLNAYLVYVLIKKTDISNTGAFIGAFLFLLHPINTQSVSHIVELGTVSGTFFGLLMLNLFLRPKNNLEVFKTILIGACFALAMFSKGSMWVFLPLLVLCGIFLEKDKKRIILPAILCTVILGFYYILKAHYVPYTPEAYKFIDKDYYSNFWIRILTFVGNLTEYFKLFLFPMNLYHVKEFVTYETILKLYPILGVIIIVLSGFAASMNKKFMFGVIWFYIAFIPYMGIVAQPSTYLESWTYVPLIGLMILISAFYDKVAVKKAFLIIVLIAAILFGARIYLRNQDWNNEEVLDVKLLAQNKGATVAMRSLANINILRGNLPKAILYLELLTLNDGGDFLTYTDLGQLYYRLGNISRAKLWLLKSLEFNPNNLLALATLLNVYEAENDKANAEKTINLIKRAKLGGDIARGDILHLN